MSLKTINLTNPADLKMISNGYGEVLDLVAEYLDKLEEDEANKS